MHLLKFDFVQSALFGHCFFNGAGPLGHQAYALKALTHETKQQRTIVLLLIQ
jgi:hypothetical protein